MAPRKPGREGEKTTNNAGKQNTTDEDAESEIPEGIENDLFVKSMLNKVTFKN